MSFKKISHLLYDLFSLVNVTIEIRCIKITLFKKILSKEQTFELNCSNICEKLSIIF